jgi:hypothetical protein
MKRTPPFLLALLLATSVAAAQAAPATPPPPWAAALAEVERMARAGSPDLALARLDALQPTAEADLGAWAAWQRLRLDILQTRHDWKALIAATAALPEATPPVLRRHALTLRADALLELGDGAGARAIAAGLLWQSDGALPASAIDRWRRQLIRAYAVDARDQDAAIAIQRHRQDDARGAAQWSTLEAELLLRAGQPKRARTALFAKEGAGADARSLLLALLADLRAGAVKPAAAFERAVALAVAKDRSSAARALAWSVAAEAAERQDNAASRIAALEKALVAQGRDADPRAFMHVAPATIWSAYRAYGEQLGNSLQLVVGNEQEWFVAATNRFDSEPVAARALSVVVATTALDAEQRQIAHWQFAQLLGRERDGGTLLTRLYLDTGDAAELVASGLAFTAPERIPAPVRYLLLEPVLAIPDIPLASKLLVGLGAPPEGADPAEWQLRRARVFVLAGRVEDGVEALDALLASGAGFALDRFLQVVFDLQTLGAHAEALRYLDPLLAQVEAPQRRRELAFWTAESYAALAAAARPQGRGAHVESARLFLMSATGSDPYAMDPWAQTARYRAAQELSRAGLHADARRQYTALLNATSDPARQAVLRHELQQLALEEAR